MPRAGSAPPPPSPEWPTIFFAMSGKVLARTRNHSETAPSGQTLYYNVFTESNLVIDGTNTTGAIVMAPTSSKSAPPLPAASSW